MAKVSAQKNSIDWDGLLKKHPLFSSVADKERALLLSDEVSKKHEFAPDDVILKQGQTGNSLFIVCEGKVSVTLTAQDGEEIDLYTLTDGEVFGEMALFGQRPRAATLIATAPSKLLEIDGDEILSMMKKHHEIANYLLARLSQRLRHTDDMILTRRISNIDTSVSDIKTQLDVMVQTTDAKLTAAQAMFDQTNTRAGEIIESAGRARTRMTFLATTATTILALVAGAGFINFQSAREEITRTQVKVEQLKGEVEKSAGQVKTYASAAGENAKKAKDNAGTAAAASSNAVEAEAKAAETKARMDESLEAAEKTVLDLDRLRREFIFSQFTSEINRGVYKKTAHEDYYESINGKQKDLRAALVTFILGQIADSTARSEFKKILQNSLSKYGDRMSDGALVATNYFVAAIHILDESPSGLVRPKSVIEKQVKDNPGVFVEIFGENAPTPAEHAGVMLILEDEDSEQTKRKSEALIQLYESLRTTG